jgi:hypothetical protein
MVARHPGSRRGFLLVTVAGMVALCVIMVTWGLQRAALRNTIAEQRVESYRAHHEREGLRALAMRWLSRQETQQALPALAEDGGVAYRAELPDEAVVTMRVGFAQGTILARVDAAESTMVRERLIDALRRLPPDRPDLVRAYGPERTDLRAAPREVLEALAGPGSAAVDALLAMRDEPPPDRGQLMSTLLSAGVDGEDARELVRVVGIRSSLWTLEATLLDRMGERRYRLLIETFGNEVVVYEIERIPTTADDGGARGGYVAGRR